MNQPAYTTLLPAGTRLDQCHPGANVFLTAARGVPASPQCPWPRSTSPLPHRSWEATRSVLRYLLHLLLPGNSAGPPGCLSLPDPAALQAAHWNTQIQDSPGEVDAIQQSWLWPLFSRMRNSGTAPTPHRTGQPGHGDMARSPLLPSGLRMLLTFCRKGFSTKAGGGQLIPTVRSLLSTSNMMASYWAGAAGGSTDSCYPMGQR